MDDPAPRKLSASDKSFALLRTGDLVVTKSSGSSLHIGKTTIVNDEIERLGCCYSNFMQRIRTNQLLLSKLAWYVMNNELSRAQFDFLSNSTTGLANLNGTMIGQVVLAIPSEAEQQAIINFLDHETAKIDALIEKQQRLIELLKEKRQAVISHAVTKGLNPNAQMKNSGVEWLGEVPAHWQVAPLKRFADVVDCKHYTVQFLDEGLPIVSIRELRDDSIDISNAKLTTRSEWNFLREGRVPRLGDIVFCRNASVGAAGYVNGDFDFCMGQDVCLIRTGLANRYMHFQITARHVREQIEAFLVGATIRRANVEEIRGLVVAFPPENEQKAIEKHLETVLSEFDALSEKAGRTVVLLIERRTALISAAVTGKIDVRDWQAAA
jgi:type I restriction enzyme S subunit